MAHGCTDDFATRTELADERKSDYANFLIQSTGSIELPFVVAAKGLLSDVITNANSNPPLGCHGLLGGLVAGDDESQENDATRNNVVAFYHPDGESTPSRRCAVDLVKLQNVAFNVRAIMEADDWKKKKTRSALLSRSLSTTAQLTKSTIAKRIWTMTAARTF
ncbi:MAG: hypothetical protein LBS82_06000 [Spirochaetaceae bacterium]|nr:hypothetical protein [Spirochaetaceae bacterium]